MAKNKKKGDARRRQRNLTEAKRKGEAAFRFAYGLYTGPKGTGCEKAMKRLLVLRRKELPGENLSACQGLLLNYRKLIIDGSEAFESLCLVLMRAVDDKALKLKVLDVLMQEFLADTDRCLSLSAKERGFAHESEDGSEGIIDALKNSEGPSRDFFRRLSAGWAGLDEYIELLGSWDYVSERSIEYFDEGSLAVKMDTLPETIKLLGKSVEAVDGRNKAADAELIDSYKNDTEFFSLISKEFFLLLSEINSKDKEYYNARLAFDRAFFQCKLIAEISTKKASEIKDIQIKGLVQKEEEAPKYGKPVIPKEMLMDGWNHERVLLANAVNAIGGEYLLSGIDLAAISALSNVSIKEARIILKKAFMLHEIRYAAENGKKSVCAYTKEKEKAEVIELVVRFWAQQLISNQIQGLLDEKRLSKGRSGSKELAEATALSERLKVENEELRARPSAKNTERDEVLKEKNAMIKELRAKLHETEVALNKERQTAEELEAENKDLRAIFDLEMGEEEGTIDITESSVVTEEFFKEYIKNNKVLIWGLRASTERRYAELYPELSFASSNRRLTRQQLAHYDTFIICTSNTNHANFWSSRDTAKALGIKMAYLAKGMNDPKHLWWALGVALGQEEAA